MFSIRWFLSTLLLFTVVSSSASPDSLYRKLGSHTDDVESVAASPNNSLYASGSWDKTISIFKNDSNKTLIQSLWGHNAVVSSLSFSRDGKSLVSGGKDYKVIVWKMNDETGEFDKTHEISMVHTAGINSVVFGPGMKTVYSAGDDGRIMIYDLAKSTSKIIEHKIPVKGIALSPNRRFIYVADESPSVKQYDGLGNLVKEFEGHTDNVNAVSYSLDNKYLVTGSSDKTAIVWDLLTGKIKTTLVGHDWKITSLDISPDSKYVITGSSDGSVKLWHIESGELISSFITGEKAVRSVAFSSDQTIVIIGAHTNDSPFEFGAFLWPSGIKRTLPTPLKPVVKTQPLPNGAVPKTATNGAAGTANSQATKAKPAATTGNTPNSNSKVVDKTEEVEIYIEEEGGGN